MIVRWCIFRQAAHSCQRGPVLSGAQGSRPPFWQGIPVYQRNLPQGSHKIRHSPEHEQRRRAVPWQCQVREHVGADEGGTDLWEAWHGKNDGGRTENPCLEIFYQLLEQQENMFRQCGASSYDKTSEILWISECRSLGIDILAKKVSTNIDNIISLSLCLRTNQKTPSLRFWDSSVKSFRTT